MSWPWSCDSVSDLSQRRDGFDPRRNPHGICGGQTAVGQITLLEGLLCLPPPLRIISRRSKWSRCLRRRFTVAHFLDLGLNPTRGMDILSLVSLVYCVSRDQCKESILRPEKSYPVSMVCESVSLGVIRCNSNPVPPQWIGKRGQTNFIWDIPVCVSDHKYVSSIPCKSHTTRKSLLLQATSFGSGYEPSIGFIGEQSHWKTLNTLYEIHYNYIHCN